MVYDLSKTLLKLGHNVTVYTTDGCAQRLNVDTNKAKLVDGIKVYYFRNISNYLRVNLKLATPYSMIMTARQTKSYDIIHIHEHRTILAVIIYYYARIYSIPYLLQAHGSLPRSKKKQKSKKLFDFLFGYSILRHASKVIALTKTEAEQYKNMGVDEDKIKIITNGVDSSKYINLPERGKFREKYGIEYDEKLISYIGRVHETKGIDMLVDAFQEIRSALPKAKLAIIGPDDGYRSKLEEKIKDSNFRDDILFTGFISNDEKIMAFRDTDVFVTPSFLGFPLTFLEACACGTPIVTTSNGDELDWIDNRVGYVVDYSKDQIKSAIFRILNDERIQLRFGEEGKRLARNEFSWDQVAKKVEYVYEECLIHHKG